MKYSFFYIPFYYNLYSRFKMSLKKTISWAIIYILPTSFLYFSNSSFNFINILIYVLAITSIYNFYEIGYIQNDNETIKKELKPTLRLTNFEFEYYKLNRFKIYSFRFILEIGLLLLIFNLNIHSYFHFNFINKVYFIVSTFSIILIYLIYNSIRNNFNIILHFLLVVVRYFSILFLCENQVSSFNFIILLFLFPIPNFIERGIESKFNFKISKILIPSEHHFKRFRIIYYSIVTFVLLGISFLKIYNVSNWVLILFFGFLFYRISNLFISNNVSDNSKYK
jgi:hypothetical protein